MDAYTGFAGVYDKFMDNIPYDEWGIYLIGLLKEYNITEGLVLDLGCGTGNITEILSTAGYDMIGIDNSDEMLNMALDKKYEHNNNILYLNQDMREFELYGTVAAVISICDSMNYIMSKDELTQVFKLVNNYLDPKGIFIFDMTTYNKFNTLGDGIIAENREEGSFIWENTFYEEEGVNEYELTIYEKGEDDRYSRYVETHFQKIYSIEEIKECLVKSGMEFIIAYKAFTHDSINEITDEERIYIIARENGK